MGTFRKLKWLTIGALALLTTAAIAADFPQDFQYPRRYEALLDAGWLWQVNSLAHPFAAFDSDTLKEIPPENSPHRWQLDYLRNFVAHTSEKSDPNGLSVTGITGIALAGETGAARRYKTLSAEPYIQADAVLRQNWYARLFVRATNEPAALPHYTGISRKIKRAGLSTGEIDQAALGYQNDWLNVEYGRGREI